MFMLCLYYNSLALYVSRRKSRKLASYVQGDLLTQRRRRRVLPIRMQIPSRRKMKESWKYLKGKYNFIFAIFGRGNSQKGTLEINVMVTRWIQCRFCVSKYLITINVYMARHVMVSRRARSITRISRAHPFQCPK